MAPVWTQGVSCLYHPLTFGSLVDAVVRRVSGKSVARILAGEISAPLGLDFWIGLPPEEEPRVAPHVQAEPALTREQFTGLLDSVGVDTGARLLNLRRPTGSRCCGPDR